MFHCMWEVILMWCGFLLNALALKYFTPAIHKFLDFISEQGSIDLPLEGRNFSWGLVHLCLQLSSLGINVLGVCLGCCTQICGYSHLKHKNMCYPMGKYCL